MDSNVGFMNATQTLSADRALSAERADLLAMLAEARASGAGIWAAGEGRVVSERVLIFKIT